MTPSFKYSAKSEKLFIVLAKVPKEKTLSTLFKVSLNSVALFRLETEVPNWIFGCVLMEVKLDMLSISLKTPITPF